MAAAKEPSRARARDFESGGLLTGLVGRDAEIHRLVAALQDVLDGSGRLVLIAGEPGSGKTRLAEELARTARARGAHVAWGRCWEEDGTPPLWPWIQVIRTCLRAVDAAVLRELVGPHGTELTNLVTTLQSGDLETSPPPESPVARFRLYNAIAYFLDSYAGRGPLVVILDDLDRADPSTLVLLQFLTQEQRQRRILVLGAYRDPVAPSNRSLTQTVVEAMREPGTELLRIGTLGLAETRQLLDALLDGAPAEQVVADLHLRTGGNPLFLTACARYLRAGDGSTPMPESAGALPIPAELREVIERRLAALSDDERGALRVAAGLADEIRVDALETVVEEPGAPGAAAACVRAAEALGLLRRGSTGDSYVFSQGMVRELLREESDAADARRHRAVRPTDIAEPEASPASGDPAAATPAEFRCEGEYWTISFAGHTARVRETKGFLYLALLLRHPGEPVHVTELVNLKGPATQPADAPGVPKDGSLAVRSGLGDAGVILDAQAKQDYRRRLAELRSELDQAQEFHDRGRVERARQEIEFLTQELAGAIGLGGRDRRTGSHSERARINVSRSIARAIERLEASHPDLARHLSRNIRTGTFCVYGPDPTLGEVWRL